MDSLPGKDALHLGSVPPEAGFGHSLVRRQRLLEAARVSDDVNEFSQDLRRERERNLRLKNLALQECVSRLVCWQLHQFELNQKGGINPDHGRESSISPRVSSSDEGNGRSTAPTDLGLRLRSDVWTWRGASRATGLSASVMTNSPSRARSRTSSARCCCASARVTVCMEILSHKSGSKPTPELGEVWRQMHLGSHLQPLRDAPRSHPAFPPQRQGDSRGPAKGAAF